MLLHLFSFVPSFIQYLLNSSVLMQRNTEENSLILTFLEQNQIPQLIRLMFNRKTAEEYLQRYGARTDAVPKKQEEHLMEDYAVRFQVKDILLLKGSQKGNIRHHCNTFIAEFLTRRLNRGIRLSPEDRKAALLQLTEFYQLEGFYEGLAELQLPLDVTGLIRKDVLRTYISPDLTQGLNEEEKRQKQTQMRSKLTEVLQRIAKYNPYIAYLQGMNNIVNFLLELGFSPTEAFFVFKRISQELLPCDYLNSLHSPIALVRLLFQVLHVTHPRAVKKIKTIMRHLDGEDRSSMALSFVFQWFICLFTNNNLPRAARTIIMERFLLEGVPVLIKAALAFFDVLEQPILHVREQERYMREVEGRIRDFSDMTILENRLNNTYINKNILFLLTEKLTLQQKTGRKRNCKHNCNPQWNLCLQVVQDRLAEGHCQEFFVFRTNQQLRLINNYFDKVHNQYFRIGSNPRRPTDLLRIARMPHSCRRSTTSITNDDDHSKRSLLECSPELESLSPKSRGRTPKKEAEVQKRALKGGQRKQLVRSKALKSLQCENSRKTVFNRSQSVQFMRSMIQNQSFSNLLQILEEEQMENIFKSVIEE